MTSASELSIILDLSPDSILSFGCEQFGQGGFLSYRRKASIRRTLDSDPIGVFVKTSDSQRTELEEAQQTSLILCKNECLFYGAMVPILDRAFARCLRLPPPYPSSLGERIHESRTLLLMEDLSEQGFRPVEEKLLSLERVRCVVDGMARLQAAYWISRVSLGGAADAAVFGRESPFFDLPRKSPIDMKTLFERGFQFAAEKLDSFVESKESRSRILRGMETLKTLVELDAQRKIPADDSMPLGIVQGDLWISNLMFRGAGDSLECRILDWQLWHVGPFGSDLGLLLMTGVQHELTKAQMRSLTSLHYRLFRETFEAETGRDAPFSEEEAFKGLAAGLISAFVWLILTSNITWSDNNIDVGNALVNLDFLLKSELELALTAALESD